MVWQEIGRVDLDGPAGDIHRLVHAVRIDQVGRPDGVPCRVEGILLGRPRHLGGGVLEPPKTA